MTRTWAPSPCQPPSVNDQRGDAIEGGSGLFREGKTPQRVSETGATVRAAAVVEPSTVQAGGAAEAGTAVCAAAVEPTPLQAAGGAATAAAVQVSGAAKTSAAKWEAFLRPSRALRIGEDLRALRLSAG